ncbi:MAG: hypothetical protein AAF611_00310 [Bacteroidota bacterium]
MDIIIFLIVVLVISHGVVLYKLRKYITAYKANNHNYITHELQRLQQTFQREVQLIDTKVHDFQTKANTVYRTLANNTNEFTEIQKSKFDDLTKFIKSDYVSLTKLLSKNNDLLNSLLERTRKSITQNEELKPALLNSNAELQKVYGKIKQLVAGSEKGVKDVKEELENTLLEIKLDSESKVKQLQSLGEKNIKDISTNNKETINEIANLSQHTLKSILSENHIQQLITKVILMEEEVKKDMESVAQKTIETNTLLNDLIEKIKAADKKKNIFGF